ncbi:hypothetical protein NVS55_00625 [Myxococcus stipitatus]|uniref:hypothetical protein n=1 Tax=Myxococcus stipitatus TaxID=83455 RepID=UPI0031455C3B
MSTLSVYHRPLSEPLPPAVADDARFRLHAWTPARRGVAMLAQAVALGSLVFFIGWLLKDILAGEQTLTPEPLVLGLLAGVGVPLLLVSVLRFLARATLEVGDTDVTLTLRTRSMLEIPFHTVASVQPWRLPLPGPGVVLRLTSGRALEYALEAEDALPLLEVLRRHGATLGDAASHPVLRYGQARKALWRKRWYHLLLKLVVFPAVPAAIFFRAHQYIAFGGAFGEYHQRGLAAYLGTFGRYYAPVALSLLLIACLWRGVAELVSLTAAWVVPSWTRGARRSVEWLGRLIFYAGILAFTAWRFLA